MTQLARRWLRWYAPRPHACARLVCFPHAGGAATFYRSWAPLVPDDVELLAVQYPGREDRFNEPFVTDMDDLAQLVCEALSSMSELPLALFGHSMGAAVAYEVALRLQHRKADLSHLMVSGREPPRHCLAKSLPRSDDELREEVLRLSDANRNLVADEMLWGLVLPAIRNDYRLVESYQPASGALLHCPVTAYIGDADPEVTPDMAADWKHVTSGAFDLQTFPGEHFYLVEHRSEMVNAVTTAVQRSLLLRRTSSTPEHNGSLRQTKSWPSTP